MGANFEVEFTVPAHEGIVEALTDFYGPAVIEGRDDIDYDNDICTFWIRTYCLKENLVKEFFELHERLQKEHEPFKMVCTVCKIDEVPTEEHEFGT